MSKTESIGLKGAKIIGDKKVSSLLHLTWPARHDGGMAASAQPITKDQVDIAAVALKKLRGSARYRADHHAEFGFTEILKLYAEQQDDGYVHTDRFGEVKVSKPSKRRERGLKFHLLLENFLSFPPLERIRLFMSGNCPVVAEEIDYSEERRPSVTVRLPE